MFLDKKTSKQCAQIRSIRKVLATIFLSKEVELFGNFWDI